MVILFATLGWYWTRKCPRTSQWPKKMFLQLAWIYLLFFIFPIFRQSVTKIFAKMKNVFNLHPPAPQSMLELLNCFSERAKCFTITNIEWGERGCVFNANSAFGKDILSLIVWKFQNVRKVSQNNDDMKFTLNVTKVCTVDPEWFLGVWGWGC